MCSWFAGASNGPTSWRTKYLHANAVNVLRPVLLAPLRFLAGIRAGNLNPATWTRDGAITTRT